MRIRVVIKQDEDGRFAASCPSLPSRWSQGDTREEAKRNIADAIDGYLESLRRNGDPLPPPHHRRHR